MSKGDERRPSRTRFGDFELDLRAGELHRAGVRVPLQHQPFRVLSLLVEKPLEVVTRDELRRELWPNDTFVDFEHGLNVAIARVREALGDSAEQPRFVETLPKRGYRFMKPLERDTRQEPERRDYVPVWAWIAAAVVILAVGAAGVFVLRRPPALTDRDTILVTDFVNKTGEEVFDDTLRQALTVNLEQSPFLNIVSRDRVRRTLKQMRRTEDVLIVDDVAREVCQRAGAAVSIDGRVTRIGAGYVVALETVRCDSGEAVASTLGQAVDREHVLDALGAAATQLRGRLGESRAMLQRFDRPLREATTSSFDALKAYTIGMDTQERQGEVAAEPFFRRAVALDPDFALAYSRLSVTLWKTYRDSEMVSVLERARGLAGRLTEHERLRFEYNLCWTHGWDLGCRRNTSELSKRTYPLDWAPNYDLCHTHMQLTGEFEKAVEFCETALRLGGSGYAIYSALAYAYRGLNRFDDVARVLDNAFARQIDALVLHAQRY